MVHLARTELAAHRAINPNFHCQITTIEMLPRSAAAEAPLNSLLMMHRPERLAAMLKDLLGKLPYGSYFDFSAFGGVVPMPFAGSVPQSEVQALLDDIHADAKRSRAYKVTIRWNPADHPPLTEPAQIAAAAAPNLDAVLWELSDGQGRREVAMDRRSKTDPLLLGTLESADIALDGKYTSGRHGAIWFDKGCWCTRMSGPWYSPPAAPRRRRRRPPNSRRGAASSSRRPKRVSRPTIRYCSGPAATVPGRHRRPRACAGARNKRSLMHQAARRKRWPACALSMPWASGRYP
jgi:hypothetical protein